MTRRLLSQGDRFASALNALYVDFYNKNCKELADDLGVDQSTISRWLSGVSRPSTKNRDAVLELLDQKEEERQARLMALSSREGSWRCELRKRLGELVDLPEEDENNVSEATREAAVALAIWLIAEERKRKSRCARLAGGLVRMLRVLVPWA